MHLLMKAQHRVQGALHLVRSVPAASTATLLVLSGLQHAHVRALQSSRPFKSSGRRACPRLRAQVRELFSSRPYRELFVHTVWFPDYANFLPIDRTKLQAHWHSGCGCTTIAAEKHLFEIQPPRAHNSMQYY